MTAEHHTAHRANPVGKCALEQRSKVTGTNHATSAVPDRQSHLVHLKLAEHIDLQAAEALPVQPRRVFKTLMAEVDGKPVCVIVPSEREVSMRKLAAAFHGKVAKMLRPSDPEQLTGYHVGGISPFAQKKRVPRAIDAAALSEPSVFLNGGQRGLQIQLIPGDARKALDAIVLPLSV